MSNRECRQPERTCIRFLIHKGVFVLEELDLKVGRSIYTRAGFTILLSLVITMVLQIVAGAIFAPYLQNDWILLSSILLPQYLVAMPLAYLLMRKVPAVPVDKKKLTVGIFAIVIMVCIAIMYAGNLIGTLFNLIIQLFTQNDVPQTLQNLVTGSSVWSTLVFMVILAPIAEELFFRKLLLPRLLPFGEKPAILLSGLAFGLYHGNFSQFFYAFGLGLAFGFIFVKTGKITYTIILHMLVNLLGSVVSVAVLQSGIAVMAVYGFIMIGLAIAGVTLFFVNLKRIRMSRGLLALPKGKSAVFFNPGTVLMYIGCAVLFVLTSLPAAS